jgi:hypothetical protein
MSIFFDHKYHIDGEDVPVKLSFKDVIFVLEDVDAASKVVHRRDGKRTADVTQTECVELPLPKSLFQLLLESNDSDCKELVELLTEKSERLKTEACKPGVLRAIAKRATLLPGLGLVGEGDDEHNVVLKDIGEEAIEAADRLMTQFSTIDNFLSVHAKALKSRLDNGAEVDDELVDELLGVAADSDSEDGTRTPKTRNLPQRSALSREVSYSKTETNGHMVYVEDRGIAKADTGTVAHATGSGPSGAIGPSANPFLKANLDQLNLTGILNVLDGVVDSPGRIVIMTTNHPGTHDLAVRCFLFSLDSPLPPQTNMARRSLGPSVDSTGPH